LPAGAGENFVLAYQAKYGQPPEAPAVYGYDAANVVIEVLREAQTKDRAGVLKAMAEPRMFKGASGEFSFDENGDTTLIVVSGNQVKDGQFKFLQLLNVP
jgi:branched-chain amino acid transport system substrate-binding protein